jgi:hypothetical protein
MKSVRWRDALTAALTEFGKTHADLANTAKGRGLEDRRCPNAA